LASADRAAHAKLAAALTQQAKAEAALAAHFEARLQKQATHAHGAKVRTARTKAAQAQQATALARAEAAASGRAADAERATFPQQTEAAHAAEAACAAAVSAAHIDVAANKSASARAKEQQKDAIKRAKQADKDKEAREKSGAEEGAEDTEARRLLTLEVERCAEVVSNLGEKQVALDARDKGAKKALGDAGRALAAVPARNKELEKEEAASEAKLQKATEAQSRAEAKLDELLEDGPRVKGRKKGQGNKGSINEGPDAAAAAAAEDKDDAAEPVQLNAGDVRAGPSGGDGEKDEEANLPRRRYSVVQREALRATFAEYGPGEDDDAARLRRAEDEAEALLLLDSARPSLEEQVAKAKASVAAAKAGVAAAEGKAAAALSDDAEAAKKLAKAAKALEAAEAKIEAAAQRVADDAASRLKAGAHRDALAARRQALGYEARLTGAGEARRQLAKKLAREQATLLACRARADRLQEKLTDFNLEVTPSHEA
jgi:hypothetical protein